MKKVLVALLCLATFASMALAEGNSVDVDFTRMDAQSAVNALYDMVDDPEANQDKTAKLQGSVYRIDGFEDEPTVYFLYMDDPSSCCGGLQLEFVPARIAGDIADFISDGEEIIITGTLDFAGDIGYPGVRLVDAVVELPTV